MKQIHLIRGVGNDLVVAYDPISGRIFELQKAFTDAIASYQGGVPVAELDGGKGRVAGELEKFEDLLCSEEQKLGRKEESEIALRVLNRLTLHVSNDCNLNCTYCYALGGNYGYARELMTQQTAADVVDFLCEHFDRVGHIVFFGGEPLLNLPAIEAVCLRFRQAYEDGRAKYLPRFGVITNGTILNDRVIRLFREHISFVTVSLDGPKEIHDFNRKGRDGQGSFEKVDRFIRRVQAETDVKIRFEGTISKEHRRRQISGHDLYSFARSEYGISGSVATDILTEDRRHEIQENLKSVQSEKMILGLPESQFYDSGVSELLPGLVHNMYREMCPVGKYIVSIDVHGDFYACHITVGTKKLSLGSIYGESIFTNRAAYESKFPFLRVVSKEHEKCKRCWMRRLCGGCAIRWFFDISTMSFLDAPKKGMCEAQGEECEKVIAALVEAKRNPQAWMELKSFMQRMEND